MIPYPNEASTAAILVVDDDDDIRTLASEMLSGAGFDVLDAADGEEALTLLSSRPVDVLFTDLTMPGMNGLVLAEAATARNPGLKILYTSGCVQHPSLGGGLARSRDGVFLPKPYRAAELVARVRGLLDGG